MRKGLVWAFLLLGTSYSFSAFWPALITADGTSTRTKPSAGAGTSDGAGIQNPAANASGAQAAKVDFQDAQPLSLICYSGTKYRGSFFVRNDEPSGGDSTVTFAAVLQDNKKDVVKPAVRLVSGNGVIPSNGFDNITLEIDTGKSEVPLSGYLQMTAKTNSSDKKPAYQYKVLKVPPALPSDLATCLFTASLFASFAVVLIALVWLALKGIKLSQRMGPPTWNFSDSWGTNITVGGALLTTLLGFSALPEQTHYLNKIAYLCLSLIFAALITVAPSIYALVRTPVNVPGSTTPQYQGYVLPFAVACGLTLWGALGQLGTVGLLFGELWAAREISQQMLLSLVTIIGLVGLLLLGYGLRTIVQIATKQQTAAAAKVEGAVPLAPGPSLPQWSVL